MTDPEKALQLLYEESEAAGSDVSLYPIRAQLVQLLMDSSRRDEAFRPIDSTMNIHAWSPADPRASYEYESFLRRVMPMLDSERAEGTLEREIAASQTHRPNCGASLRTDRTSIELDCTESRVLSLLRLSSRPGLTMKALEALPGLKAKLDGIGGIDVLFQERAPVVFRSNSSPATMDKAAIRELLRSPDRLFRELRGKARYVRTIPDARKFACLIQIAAALSARN